MNLSHSLLITCRLQMLLSLPYPFKGKSYIFQQSWTIITLKLLRRSPNLGIALTLLKEAIKRHLNHLDQLTIHSDQSFHYQHRNWNQLIEKVNAKMSMSRKGNCLDNAPMENFFGLLKQEMFYGECFESYEELEVTIH